MSDWIEWKWSEEKPYPETLDTFIQTKRSDGGEDCNISLPVSFWYGSGCEATSSFRSDEEGHITHYKVTNR